jgi:hypothetical protein
MQAIYDKCMNWYPDDWGGPDVKGEMWVSNTHTTVSDSPYHQSRFFFYFVSFSESLFEGGY